MKRAFKIVGIVFAALVVATLVAGLAINWAALAQSQFDKRRPAIEAQVGRSLELKVSSLRLLPSLRGEVRAIKIGPDAKRPDFKSPLLAIDSVRFDVSLFRAVLTRHVSVNDLSVEGLSVNVARYADRSLSYDDLVKASPADEPVSKASEPLLDGLSVGHLRITDAALSLTDFATQGSKPVESELKKINLTLDNLRAGGDLRVQLDAAVLADAKNFELDVALSELPADLDFKGAPKLTHLSLDLRAVELKRLLDFLPAGAVDGLDSALVSAKWQMGPLSKDKHLPVKGLLEAKAVHFKGGQKFDASLEANLAAQLEPLGADVSSLRLKVGDIELGAQGSVSDIGKATRFKNLSVSSSTLSPGALFLYYPALKEGLPAGLKLQGAGSLALKADGTAEHQTVSGTLDLSGLEVHWPGHFTKPASVPMAVKIDSELSPSDLTLKQLSLVLDALEVTAAGTVKNFKQPSFDLKVSAKPFAFDRLVRLAPSVREQLEKKKVAAQGVGQLDGHLRGTQENLDAHLAVALAGLKLDVPGTRVDGDIKLVATVVGNPKADVKAEIDFDASAATLKIERTLDKAKNVPMLLKASVQRTGHLLELKKSELKLAELNLHASGNADYSKHTLNARADFDRLDLEKFARTVTSIPPAMAKNGTLAFSLAVTGDPERPEADVLTLSGLEARFGRSDLRGSMTVKNLRTPDAVLTATSNTLDLDELIGDSSASKSEKKAAKTEKDDPSMKEYRLSATFNAQRVIYEQAELSHVACTVKLSDGVLVLETCGFNAYGGTVAAQGTQAEIWRAQMPFKANLRAQHIELGQALAQQTRYGALLQGKADLNLKLDGKGFETAELEKFLIGSIDLGLKEGRFAKASFVEAVFGKLGTLSKLAPPKAGASDNHLRDLNAQLEVKDGRMRLTHPVTFDLDGGKATLEGAVGIAGKLFLKGTYLMPGPMVGKLTQGRCSSERELPIPFDVVGSLDSPEYRPEVTGVAKSLFESCLQQRATTAVRDAVKEKTGLDADEARRRLEEEAKKKAGGLLKGFIP